MRVRLFSPSELIASVRLPILFVSDNFRERKSKGRQIGGLAIFSYTFNKRRLNQPTPTSKAYRGGFLRRHRAGEKISDSRPT